MISLTFGEFAFLIVALSACGFGIGAGVTRLYWNV